MEIQERKSFIDSMRTLAIFLMLFFHFCYDLTAFGYIRIDFYKDPFWFYLPRLIVVLFLLSSAASLVFTHKNGLNKKKFFVRFFKIAGCAVGISIVTFFIFPDHWIFLGTLHCIALTSLIAIPFLNSPKLSLSLAIISLVLTIGFGFDTQYFSTFYTFKSMDFIPPFPWMGWVWFGIFLAHTKIYSIKVPSEKLNKLTKLISKHSLKIYLLHQPILYGVIWAFFSYQKSK